MNIGIFTDSYKPDISGVMVSIRTLKDALTARGHRVFIFAPGNPDAKEEENVYRLPSIPVIFYKSLRMAVIVTPEALTAIRQIKLDVIHTQTELTVGFFANAVGKILDLPVIHTYHTMYKDYVYYVTKGKLVRLSENIVKVLSRNFCNADDMIIAPTDKVKKLLLSYGVKKPIAIIPSGVDLGRFHAAAADPGTRDAVRKELGIAGDTPLVVFVGRVAKEKSIDMIIRAMPALLAKVPGARLMIVGEGGEKAALETLAAETCPPGSVIFTGAKAWTDIPSYFRAGDVFVSASATETQGLTILEAMASEVPVVARRDPSFAEMISEGVDGLQFSSEAELSEMLIRVLSDREGTSDLIDSALKKTIVYSAETFGLRIEKAYLEAITLHEAHSRGFLHRLRRMLSRAIGKR